ncbi:MAG: RraA family protein [Calditrichaeota bacterium]|nr:RraA family protein [Calditrichota bacterium]
MAKTASSLAAGTGVEIDDEVIRKLAQYPTPTVSNVIELFEVRPKDEGFLGAEIKALHPDHPPVVGFAATATLRSAAEPHANEKETSFARLLEMMLDLPEPRIAVFQDLDRPPRGGTVGECVASALAAFGATAVVTSGYARDIKEVAERGFSFFASGISPSHGYGRTVDVMIPVEIANQRISPGTLIHADVNGVVIVPREIAPWVAAALEDYERVEREYREAFDRQGAAVNPWAVMEKAHKKLAVLQEKVVAMWKKGRRPDLNKTFLDW